MQERLRAPCAAKTSFATHAPRLGPGAGALAAAVAPGPSDWASSSRSARRCSRATTVGHVNGGLAACTRSFSRASLALRPDPGGSPWLRTTIASSTSSRERDAHGQSPGVFEDARGSLRRHSKRSPAVNLRKRLHHTSEGGERCEYTRRLRNAFAGHRPGTRRRRASCARRFDHREMKAADPGARQGRPLAAHAKTPRRGRCAQPRGSAEMLGLVSRTWRNGRCG